MVIEALNAERESSLSISHTTFLRVCLFGPGLVGSPAFFLLACLAGAGQPGREREKEECELTLVIESDCFGWALEESLEDHGLRLRPRHEGCRHYRRSRSALLKDSVVAAMAAAVLDDVAEPGGLEGRKGGGGGVGETRTEKERRW